MLFKILTCILAALVLAEAGYIFLARHPISRFKPVDEDGYLAFDSATGQLCGTFRAVSSSHSPESEAEGTRREPLQAILEAIQKEKAAAKRPPRVTPEEAKTLGLTPTQHSFDVLEVARLEITRGLPACADIH